MPRHSKKPRVSIEGFETGPATKSSKSQTYGTDLGIEKTEAAFARPGEKKKSYQEPGILEEQPFAGDLAKLLELEISFYRHPNDEEVLKEMIEYADTYKDPNMAQRAFEMAKHMHNSADALAAALLWITLEPNSSQAQNNYIRELIIQSKYPKAFDFMANRLDRGLPADFRLIGSFLTPQSEQQMRALISTYDRHLQSYPFVAGNLREGQQIAEYKLAEFLFYNQRLTDSLRVLNRILPEKTVQANVRTAATSLKARIYYLTQQPGGDFFYEEEIKKDKDNVLLNTYYALYLINTQRQNMADTLLTRLLRSKNDDATVYLLTTVAQDKGLPKLHKAGLEYYKKNRTQGRSGLYATRLASRKQRKLCSCRRPCIPHQRGLRLHGNRQPAAFTSDHTNQRVLQKRRDFGRDLQKKQKCISGHGR